MSEVLIKSCATCAHHALSKDWCNQRGISATPLQCRCKGEDYVRRMKDKDRFPATQKIAVRMADVICKEIAVIVARSSATTGIEGDLKMPRDILRRLLVDELRRR